MTTNPQNPTAIAAEFAGIFAEQADLHRRAFRLLETLFVSTATIPAPVSAEPVISGGTESGDAPEQSDGDRIVPTDREQAVGDAIKVAGLRPEAVAVAAIASEAPEPVTRSDPECASLQDPISEPVRQHPRRAAPATKKDRVLDLYAETLLTTTQMSERLNINKSSVSAFISLARTSKDPRAIAGDDGRRAHRAKVNERATAANPVSVPSAPVSDSVRPPVPTPPVSPALLKLKGQVQASMKDRVLNLYAETGDHASVIAQKLGLLRTNVSAYIVNAGAEKDQRVIQGDRIRARRAGGRP